VDSSAAEAVLMVLTSSMGLSGDWRPFKQHYFLSSRRSKGIMGSVWLSHLSFFQVGVGNEYELELIT
jgi:hypothetical protein